MPEFIEGRNPILEALRSDHPLNKILIAKNIERHKTILEIIELTKAKKIPLEWVERKALDRISFSGKHQGLIAFAAAHKYVDVVDLLNTAKDKKENPYLVMLDGIEDPHNLGAILRTAEATGAHGVIILKRRAVPLTSTVAKVSAGAIEYVGVTRVPNLSTTMDYLKKEGLWMVGVEAGAEKSYREVDLKLPIAIIIGGEGKGISRLVKEKCDFLVSISMKGRITSLNASVAAGIILYEVFNQRRA